MVNSKMVFFAFLALSVLLAMMSESSIWSQSKGVSSLCCKDHYNFGVCNVNRHCNKWCLRGCNNKKGGFCKKKVCHCYC
ncbi:unnamed protein product [Cochlearia groenlandica]